MEWDIVEEKSRKMGAATDAASNDIIRCYTGWLMMMGAKTTYTGFEK